MLKPTLLHTGSITFTLVIGSESSFSFCDFFCHVTEVFKMSKTKDGESNRN